MTAHRTLEGEWAECATPDSCELKFHFAEMTAAQMSAMPLSALLPLLTVLDPPSQVAPSGLESYWHDELGRLHRDYDLPAEIGTNGSLLWAQHGVTHRDHDRPAVIGYDGTQDWYRNGRGHRDGDKPASIYPDGRKYWFTDGHGTKAEENGEVFALPIDPRQAR